MQEHPHKIDLRDQLITYLLGQSDIDARDLEELLSNIFSPVLKQEIMISGKGFLAVAAREAAAATRAEVQKEAQKKAEKAAKKAKLAIEAAQQEAEKAKQEAEKAKQEAILEKRLRVMQSWHRDIAIDWIPDITGMPYDEVKQLIVAFEKVKNAFDANRTMETNELVNLSGLTEFEINTLLTFLQK